MSATAQAIVLAGERARAAQIAPKPTAAEDALLLAEVRAGYHPNPARVVQQVLACARKAKGQVEPPLPPWLAQFWTQAERLAVFRRWKDDEWRFVKRPN